jgi:gamma-glutamylcyclotransferase (GGCT)/AIG2-like uncharacterized protein YtfP
MNDDQWYFAYGSNMFIDQKEGRTGRIRQAIRCRLMGFRFAFNKRGSGRQVYANIAPDDAAEVWGVIYLCNLKAIQEMDRYEGVAGGNYERILVTVEKESGEKVEAITYVAGGAFVCNPGNPSVEYLERIVSGARHHSLPDQYVRMIKSLAH